MKEKQRRLIDKLSRYAATKALPGSDRTRRRQDKLIGKLHEKHGVRVTLYLRPRSSRGDAETVDAPEGRHLTHEEFEAIHGAHPEDMKQVLEFAAAHEMEVLEQDLLKRRVRLKGAPAQIKKAFNVDLLYFERPDGKHHGHEGPVHVPEVLEGIVTSVFGLDGRPVARRSMARPAPEKRKPARRKPAASPKKIAGFTPLDAGKAYRFPPELDGSGQCVGIVQLDGGYKPEEMQSYFDRLGIDFDVSKKVIAHGPNRYAGDLDPLDPDALDQDDAARFFIDAEVAMDLEIAAGLAPGADFVIYFAEDDSRTSEAFIATVDDAIFDSRHRPSVISISWASGEKDWTEQEAKEMEQKIRHGAQLGITVCVSSGDYGAYEKPGSETRQTDWSKGTGTADGSQHIDWYGDGDDTADADDEKGRLEVLLPASAPHALACGGTTRGKTGEIVWDGSTGGVSALFGLPAYQKKAHVPEVPDEGYRPGFKGRGVPDVAASADQYVSAYAVLAHGIWAPDPDAFGGIGGGGTSAVAPLWAALVARLNQGLGRRLGFLHPELYALEGSTAFHPITKGTNGYYEAGPGWNACTGLGTPNGVELLKLLK